MHISPSAISHAIACLEAELEVQLFVRHGKRIQLNSQGRILLEEASKVLESVERLPNIFKKGAKDLQGSFRVGATHSLAVRFLVRVTSELEKKHPKLAFEIKIAPSTQISAMLLSGQLDFGLCYGPVNHPELVTEFLAEDPFVVAVRKNHPVQELSQKNKRKALSKMKAAAPRLYSGKSNLEHRALEDSGIEQNVSFVFSGYDIAIEKLRSSEDSWALLPRTLVNDSAGIEAVELSKWACTEKIIGAWFRPNGLPLPCMSLLERLAILISSAK